MISLPDIPEFIAKEKSWKARRKLWVRNHPKTHTLLSYVSLEAPLLDEQFPYPLDLGHDLTRNPQYFSNGRLRSSHRICVFHYTLAGHGVFSFNGQKHSIQKEHGVLFRADDPQVSYCFPQSAHEPWEFLWINFSGVAAHAMVSQLIKLHGHVYQIPRTHLLIQWMFTTLKNKADAVGTASTESVRHVTDLLLTLGDVALDNEKRSPHGISLAHRAIDLISIHGKKSEFSISFLAHQLGVSREHLSRTFCREMDVPLQPFLENWRIRHACQLLKETNLSIKEIAASVGYSIPHSFIQAFKRQKNATPREYRFL